MGNIDPLSDPRQDAVSPDMGSSGGPDPRKAVIPDLGRFHDRLTAITAERMGQQASAAPTGLSTVRNKFRNVGVGLISRWLDRWRPKTPDSTAMVPPPKG